MFVKFCPPPPNLDAVRQDVASIAASAQGYYIKPTMLGGGGQNFTNITFNDIAFAADSVSTNGLNAINQNGVYVISNGAAGSFDVTAHPASRITDSPILLSSTVATSGEELSATVTPDNLTYN
jgi:hypothetical protein